MTAWLLLACTGGTGATGDSDPGTTGDTAPTVEDGDSGTTDDACSDLNCDGYPDLVFAQTDEAGHYAIDSIVYLGGPDGFSEDAVVRLPTVGAMGVVAADLDGDGTQDLVFASVQDGERRDIDSYVFYNGPEGFDVEGRVALPTVGCADPTAGDLDQDGWTDLVFSNRFSGGSPTLEAYENDSYVYWGGPEGYSEDRRLGLPTVGAARSRIADLDGDGHRDLVFANGVMDLYGVLHSPIYWGSEEGWSADDVTELPSNFAEGLAVHDLTGDGELDLLFSTWLCLLECDEVSQLYVGDGTRDLGPEPDERLAGIEGAVDVQVADLDADGHLDLVLANGGVDLSGNFAEVSWIWWGTSAGPATGELQELPTTAASEAGVRDLDGDGWLDVVFASHYAPEDGGPEVSQIYWGSAEGFSAERVTELPTTRAAGMTIVGRHLGR